LEQSENEREAAAGIKTLRAVVEEARQRGKGAASETAITMSLRVLISAVCLAAEQLDDPAAGGLMIALLAHADQLGCYYFLGRQLLKATANKPELLERLLLLGAAVLFDESPPHSETASDGGEVAEEHGGEVT
jgi:hypothetical protein